MTDDRDEPETESRKSGKARDWLIIVALVVAVAVILYFGTMDPAQRYKLIGL